MSSLANSPQGRATKRLLERVAVAIMQPKGCVLSPEARRARAVGAPSAGEVLFQMKLKLTSVMVDHYDKAPRF